VGLTTLTIKSKLVMKCYKGDQTWTDSLDKRPKLRMDKSSGMRNVRSLYRAGSLMTAVKQITRYKLHLVGVQIR
jgi:hypothetical protein